jgi:hypothetical protein
MEVRKTALNPELALRKAGNACTAVRVAKKPLTSPSTTQVREALFILNLLSGIIRRFDLFFIKFMSLCRKTK